MADKKDQRRGLGRGLSALMADVEAAPTEASGGAEQARQPDRRIPIEDIVANPNQPRRKFTQDQLEELANSIRTKGVIQPLIVRPHPDAPGKFQIVAGERRWRASQMAQLHELPVIVRDFDDTEVLEVAIIENIQRADLNAIEEAAGFRQLMDRFGHTQEKLAEALGKSRSHIANLLRLLNLPDEVRDLVETGKLSAGHARALITSENPIELAKKVVAEALSVRQTEKLVKGETEPKKAPTQSGASRSVPAEKDADTRALEGDLSAALGMSVSIEHDTGGEGGRVVIRYHSLDQLDDVCMRLSGGH
ncbi:ParB/RepB/Spo0J family partition protein [Pseudoprimorskyibacter insulae]|uniref:Chromosome-partitioning protein ParB n=1 Tax=Pseudoprimorskyibacter insulae TaxID=1695997 RepID=A0A2R8ATS6_9RHOB|nr:ParB/RepB/Spo0J family partition protein [Pseudoprimorskyibacter insulae]SPF79451.1 Chromosome-partitioning protein ParB [Pseudoprimorskyibacter insulae]